MNNPLIIDLGCGRNKHKGAIGVDNIKLDTVDIVHDLLDFPYPFENNCADEIILSHVLEHFILSDIIKILNEVGRILKKDGVVTVSIPHAFSPAAFQDPGHKTFFTYESFYHFIEGFVTSYRHDFQLNNSWIIKKIWTTVNVFNDHFVQITKNKQRISNLFSKLLNFILHTDKSMTLPEIAAKVLPVWLINIHVELRKVK